MVVASVMVAGGMALEAVVAVAQAMVGVAAAIGCAA